MLTAGEIISHSLVINTLSSFSKVGFFLLLDHVYLPPEIKISLKSLARMIVLKRSENLFYWKDLLFFDEYLSILKSPPIMNGSVDLEQKDANSTKKSSLGSY